MFSFLKALDPSVWLGIIIALIVAGVLGKMAYDNHEIAALKHDAVVSGVTIAVQADTIKTDGKVAVLKNDSQKEVAADVKKAEVKHASIQAKVDKQERTIIDTFDAKPSTVDNIVEEQEQLSSVRINGLWEAYCTAKPDATNCPVKPTEGEQHA